jgi:predicted glycogen debranching enzyme
MQLSPDITTNLSKALACEWLETNRLGGWASSTVAGAHTRRYHGLLVAATQPPVGRMVLLSKLEETLLLEHERVELGCNLFPGAVHPRGHTFLQSFALDPFPTFTYATADLRLRKTVALLEGEHTLLIVYELERAPAPLSLELRPFFAGRDYHHLLRADDSIQRNAHFAEGVLSFQPYPDQPTIHLLVPGASFAPAPDWYYNFEYPREAERGLDYREDLFTCGVLHCTLEAGGKLEIIASTQNPSGRKAAQLLQEERLRRENRPVPQVGKDDPLARQLARAADQFLVRRDGQLHTILAGYHWFTDWGRDTMIALPGICLVNGRHAEARSIFQAFAAHVSEGMIPNRFPDAGEEPEYNTVDATLWFFAALYKYLHYTDDYEFVRAELWPILQDIIAWHRRGTRYGIRLEADGLLSAGVDGVQLTWMDAKVGDWIVTPRQGKPVEINALWYNALCIMAHLARHFGEQEKEREFQHQAECTGQSFGELFWNEAENCLFDVIDADWRDPAIRPNQIFALSLPFPLLSGTRAHQVFEAVDHHLFTPRGLRSLSPADPAYRSHYGGSPHERDGAYHQGIVWGWLLGPFITVLVRLHGEKGRQRARQIVHDLEPHLSEAGLGSFSEIFDAEPPFAPRGCVAQAWSVAEVLRAYCEDVLEELTLSRFKRKKYDISGTHFARRVGESSFVSP